MKEDAGWLIMRGEEERPRLVREGPEAEAGLVEFYINCLYCVWKVIPSGPWAS